MFSQCAATFNLDKHLISFLQDSPFFAELSRHIHKCPSKDLPTAAVAFDQKNDTLTLYWNPDFFASMSTWEVRGVLTHEYYHLVFGHLYGRRRTPPKLWNIATDLAINSIILAAAKSGTNSRLEGDRPLPEFALVPGVFPKNRDGKDFTPEEKATMKLAEIIAGLPPMQASEWYFEKIKDELEEAGEPLPGDCEGGVDSMDDHGTWEDIPEDMREYVEGKVKAIVAKAAKHACSQSNGWGNIPKDMIEAIRKSVSNVINWRSVLRQFVGSLVRGARSTSIKRINKRYPYIHPGVKRGYEAKLLVAIDQSGSVDNEMLVEFFAELGSLTKKVTIDVLPFDTEALDKDIFTWRKGQAVPPKRIRCGGTDFNAPTETANAVRNRGRWDGFLCMSDGECSAPGPSRIKRGYVIGRGQKLLFPTTDLVVKMDGNKQITGAWR